MTELEYFEAVLENYTKLFVVLSDNGKLPICKKVSDSQLAVLAWLDEGEARRFKADRFDARHPPFPTTVAPWTRQEFLELVNGFSTEPRPQYVIEIQDAAHRFDNPPRGHAGVFHMAPPDTATTDPPRLQSFSFECRTSASSSNPMKRLVQHLFSTSPSCCWAADLGDLALRLVAGLSMALAHGRMKFPPSEQFIAGVSKLGFPAPGLFAWAATLSELLGGLLLAAGLLTRVSGLLLAGTMAVAAFLQHRADPFQRKELALLYLAIAVMYLLRGAGRFSVDYLLSRKLHRSE